MGRFHCLPPSRLRTLHTCAVALGCLVACGCVIHNHFFENVRLPDLEPGGLQTRPTPATSRPSTQPAGVLDRILGAAADEAERVLHGD
ncbi:MAG: hypothetical protein E6Q97_15810 [Desulfurellales bacterium]|nr:MAG: hypothetical protein E6Q97_15810 [Desulfurellales bacterium]